MGQLELAEVTELAGIRLALEFAVRDLRIGNVGRGTAHIEVVSDCRDALRRIGRLQANRNGYEGTYAEEILELVDEIGDQGLWVSFRWMARNSTVELWQADAWAREASVQSWLHQLRPGQTLTVDRS